MTDHNSSPAATWEEIGSLVPWEKNPRHNQDAIQHVAASIKRFGFSSPIFARSADRVVIAGHTRLLAAQQLGLSKVPVRFMDLDPDQAAALALADNKLGELASWDDQGVADILQELADSKVDVSDLGWSAAELDALITIPDFLNHSNPADLSTAAEYKCPKCDASVTPNQLIRVK